MTQEQMNRILHVGIALTSEKKTGVLLEKIMSEAMAIANCDAGTLYLLEKDQLKFTIMRNHTLGIYEGGDDAEIRLPRVPMDREHVSSLALLESRTINIADAYDENLESVFQGPKNYDSVTGYHTKSVLVVPMQGHANEQIGVIQLINAMDEKGQVCAFSEDVVMCLESIASEAAVAISNAQYIEENEKMLQSFIETMVTAVGTLTPYNANHTRNMVTIGRKFIRYLKDTSYAMSKEHENEFIVSIWLHDIGKLVTPVAIMNKNTRLWPAQKEEIMHRLESFSLMTEIELLKGRITEEKSRMLNQRIQEITDFIKIADTGAFEGREETLRKFSSWTFTRTNGERVPYLTKDEISQLSVDYRTLTDEERDIMHNHVVQTERLLSSMRFPKDMPHVKEWASSHHELLNGRGYPRHLTAVDIPYEVRILTILDIFEALTATDREYKKPKSPEEAVAHLKSLAAFGELDGNLVKLFAESRAWD